MNTPDATSRSAFLLASSGEMFGVETRSISELSK